MFTTRILLSSTGNGEIGKDPSLSNIRGKKNLYFNKVWNLTRVYYQCNTTSIFCKLAFFNSNTLLSMQICTISFRTLCTAILQWSSQESCIKGNLYYHDGWREKKLNVNYKQSTPLTRMGSVWLIVAQHPAIEKWEHKKIRWRKPKLNWWSSADKEHDTL